jgi:hypothetical protein
VEGDATAVDQSPASRVPHLARRILPAVRRYAPPTRNRTTLQRNSKLVLRATATINGTPQSDLDHGDLVLEPHFTGQSKVLTTLRETLTCAEPFMALVSMLSVSGVSGIGKTKIACEYAHRYATDTACVKRYKFIGSFRQ